MQVEAALLGNDLAAVYIAPVTYQPFSTTVELPHLVIYHFIKTPMCPWYCIQLLDALSYSQCAPRVSSNR